MMPWPRTLLWKLCLALIGIQIVVIVGLGWYADRHVAAHHREQAVAELERLAPILFDRYREALQALDERTDAPAELQQLVTRDGQARRGLRITVIADDGRVLADSMEEPAVMDNHRHRPEVAATFRTGSGTSIRYSNTVNEDMVYVAQRYDTSARAMHVLRTALVLDRADAGLIATRRVLAIGGLVSLLVTGGLFYLVSRRVSQSVRRLADESAAAASSDRRTPIDTPPMRELAPIADSLNELTAKLHDRIEDLSRKQREHEAILQSMNSGVVALDSEQRIIGINHAAARMFDLDPEAAHNRLLHEVIRHPAVHRHAKEALRDAEGSLKGAAEKGSGMTELQIRSDPPTIVELTSSRLSDDSGGAAGLLLVFNNVTELRRLESIRSDFAANVSHELRTPITNIKGYIETMLEVGTSDEAQVKRFLEIIKRNADRLAAIIEDILSLAWLEQPGTREGLVREPVSVAQIVGAVIDEFENAADAKDIQLRSEVPDSLEAPVNRPLIEQALANYLSNALKYSPPGTSTTVRASHNGSGEIELAVIDQGPGISANHRERIFERFYRVDKARSRELGGTGLGLAIVKHIALVHGGRVEVESTLGKGSTFKLILPG